MLTISFNVRCYNILTTSFNVRCYIMLTTYFNVRCDTISCKRMFNSNFIMPLIPTRAPRGGRWGRLSRAANASEAPKSHEVLWNYAINILTLILLNISLGNNKFLEISKRMPFSGALVFCFFSLQFHNEVIRSTIVRRME